MMLTERQHLVVTGGFYTVKALLGVGLVKKKKVKAHEKCFTKIFIYNF